ncbi:MAG: ABC transporter permease [Acidimicrobiia bacterium]|nr:ABC transporter permease [Acidimicrobiia bacterium]MDQ3501118.1 ABC transporter permease [Actinomycetota bacterium]
MSLPVYDSALPRRPLVTEFQNLWTHRGLLRLLVNRELSVRYKRSSLGVWWTLLNPLLTTAIMWVVFAQIFQDRFGATGDEPYVVYLLAGVLFFAFFSQGLLATGSAITGSASILTKVYVPAEVFSFATALAGVANFAISLAPLLVVQLIAGVGIPWTILLSPVPVVAMLALVTGLGMLVAAAAVRFYDVIELTRVLVILLTYATPVFYPISIIPERFLSFVYANPLFSYLEVFRSLFYRGEIPPLWQWAMVVGSALVALGLGVWAFSRSWRNLVSSL